MNQDIYQLFQQGLEAHQKGDLQSAEEKYLGVLESQPLHPDANHNLGVIAVSVGNTERALAYFKKALDANPAVEQFWLSVADTLIKDQRPEEARKLLDNAAGLGVHAKTSPDFAEAHYNLGVSLQKLAKPIEAEEAYSFAITLQPEHVGAHNNLGVIFQKSGRPVSAEASFRTAIELKPDFARAHSNLGNILKESGKLKEAEAAYRKALAIDSDFADAHYNLGVTLGQLGQHEEAKTCFEKAIALEPASAEAHFNLGNTLRELTQFYKSGSHYNQAIKLDPSYSEARINLNRMSALAVPAWHLSMMNDHKRNEAYANAIQLAVEEGDLVLDIGTGSGLLSMMAAAKGAQVVTCETSEIIARTAKKIISTNGYQKEVSVINKKSIELEVGVDLPKPADLVISEVLSAEFVGEDVRRTIWDAKTRLIKSNGTMIPQSGSIKVALLGSDAEIDKFVRVANVHGFDLSEFNSITQNKFGLSLVSKPVLLSEPKNVFNIDFNSRNKPANEEQVIGIEATQSGMCIGLVQWIRVALYGDIFYENQPGDGFSHWPNPVYIFDKPIPVKQRDLLKISAFLGEDSLWFNHLPEK